MYAFTFVFCLSNFFSHLFVISRYTVSDSLNFGVGLWRVTNCSGSYGVPCTEYDVPVNITCKSSHFRTILLEVDNELTV